MGTQSDQKLIGYLSTVYPGLVPLALTRLGPSEDSAEGSDNQALQALSLRPASLVRSRVCEQVWLDGELFDQSAERLIYATAEEDYRRLASAGLADADVKPASLFGRFGEQLVLRELQPSAFLTGAQFKVADVVLECAGSTVCNVNHSSDAAPDGQASHMAIYAFRIIEPGLVEPGAAITIID